jgi:predicted ester cyclase
MSTTANSEIVRAFMAALDNNDLDTAAGYLDDQFLFGGWTPRDITRQELFDIMKGLKEGIPDLRFNLNNVQEHGDTVNATIQVTGHQSDSFILPTFGLPPIPQTANDVLLPVEEVGYLVEDGRIARWNAQPGKDVGVIGILHQLGIEVPDLAI